MKRVKKYTTSINIFIFICATILLLYQLWEIVDPGSINQNICSVFHKSIFTVFLILVFAYKVCSIRLLLNGLFAIICIGVCYAFRNEFEFDTIYQFAMVYLFALPFSEFLDDSKERKYLKWFACLYSAISVYNLICSYLLLFGIGLDILPSRFSFHQMRLTVGPHPNITAMLFAIAICMFLVLFLETKSKILKGITFVLICGCFPPMWITNCRTSVLLMIGFIIALLFFAFLSKNKNPNFKRIVLVIVALLVGMFLLIFLYNRIFLHHRDSMLEKIDGHVDIQMSFWDSLATFNGRTDIWKAAVDIVLSEKRHLYFGTGMTIAYGGAWHAHNAWVQCFLNFGLFGLLFSVYYTIRALKAAVNILILDAKRSTLLQKSIVMMVCVLLVANTMEPYIFVNLFTCTNFILFLLLGYAMKWERELKYEKVPAKDVKIVVATHKAYEMPKDRLYIPLHVGRSISNDTDKTLLRYVGDNTGNNISYKNSGYCELTGLYWAWKNLDFEYIGLVHYRRYFAKNKIGPKWKRIADRACLDRLLDEYDVILPKKRNYFIETTYTQYIHAHNKQDLDKTEKILRQYYPEYLEAYQTSMKSTKGHKFNMLIMKRELLDDYCKWLFGFLLKLEDRLDFSKYSPKDQRVFGYVAERLLDVWLITNNITYAELPVVHMESQHWIRKIYMFLLRKIRGCYRE